MIRHSARRRILAIYFSLSKLSSVFCLRTAAASASQLTVPPRPIGGQYQGLVITLNQSEASEHRENRENVH